MIAMQQVSNHFTDQLKVLACFDPANLTVGIKLRSDMSDELRQAAQTLFEQGIISATDGGYLTPFGMTLVEHLQHLLVALKPGK
ncbi:MAG: TIGR02647 family protein [Aeromonas sp.]